MDNKHFVSRSIQTSILFAVILFPFLSQKFEPVVVWGFLSGVLLSAGNFYLIASLAKMLFTPLAAFDPSRGKVLFYAGLKFPIFYAIFVFLLGQLHFSTGALMVGFLVPFVVVTLKSIRSMYVTRLAQDRDYGSSARTA
ncbi:MAG: hypothetical protein AAB317_01915 [Nitrospirota bacterium]